MSILKRLRESRKDKKKIKHNPFFNGYEDISEDSSHEENIKELEEKDILLEDVNFINNHKKKRKNFGKAKKPQEKRRTKTISVVVTEEEFTDISKCAKTLQISKSSYIRMLLKKDLYDMDRE